MMIENMEGYFWETVYILKQMHDHGCAAGTLACYQNAEISGDYVYEMALEAIVDIFAETGNYYNQDREIETYVFFDPMFTEFYRLCEGYEKKLGIAPEENKFRKAMDQEITTGCQFNSYSYGYNMMTNTNSRLGCRLVLLFDPEFYCHHEVPGGLLDIRDAFIYHMKELKKALGLEMPCNIIALQPANSEMKEAA